MAEYEWQKLRFPFVAGIDTKTDAKLLPAPRLTTLENGVLTTQGAIKKRNGYTTIAAPNTTNSVPQTMVPFRDQVAAIDLGQLHARMDAFSDWTTGSGGNRIHQTEVVLRPVESRGTRERHTSDYAENGNCGVLASESTSGIYVNVFDVSSYAVITAALLSGGTSGTRPKVVATTNYVFIIFYEASSTAIKAARLTPSTGAFGSVFTVTTNVDAATPIFDVCKAPAIDEVLVCYNTSTASTVGLRAINESNTVSAETTLATAAAPVVLTICADPTGAADEVGVAVANSGNNIRAITYAYTSGGNFSANFAVMTLLAVGATMSAIGGLLDGTGNRFVVLYELSNASSYLKSVAMAVCNATTGGSISNANLAQHTCLASKPTVLRYTGVSGDAVRQYVWLGQHVSTLQSTYFMYSSAAATSSQSITSTSGWTLAARTMPGPAGGTYPSANTLPNTFLRGSAGKCLVACVYKKRLVTPTTTTADNASFTGRDTSIAEFNFQPTSMSAPVEVGDATYIPGGIVYAYDGLSVAEANFLLFPENVTGVASNGTGSLDASSTYWYRVYFESITKQGERVRSTTCAAVAVTTGVADDTVTLTIPTLAHTSKSVGVVVYRTPKNPTEGALFYRCSSPDASATGNNGYITNVPGSSTVTFVDGMTDALLTVNEIDYLSTGELDNVAPAAATAIAAGRRRIFSAGGENYGSVWASKLQFQGDGIAWNESLIVDVGQVGGPVTALAVMSEMLVVFKENRIIGIAGDGPSNTGDGSFSEPRVISTEVGCITAASVVQIPQGVLFASNRGIYLLDQSGGLSYVGAPVESYNSQTVRAATILESVHQVRFLVSSGSTLVYDYEHNQWSVFTGHNGVSAVVVNGTYHYQRNDGTIYKEASGTYTDNSSSIALVAETGWINLAGVAGRQKLRELQWVGEWRSSHTFRVTAYYDYDTSSSVTYSYTKSAAPQNDRAYLGRKCKAVKLRFEDVTPTGQSFDLNEFGLEVGLLPGLDKIPASRSL